MKGTLVSTLQSDDKAEETIERGHDADLGWCPEHDDIAWRYAEEYANADIEDTSV
jgi:hypothetical protein